MRIPPLDFIPARDMAHAVALMQTSGPGVQLLAGGTDLVLNLKKKRADVNTLVSLQAVNGLDGIRETDAMIRIGAMATHDALARHPLLKEKADILCQAVGLIGSWQIRNAGTIGGNICNASPAGDSLPVLLALDAEFTAAGPEGDRTFAADGFFTGPGTTRLAPGHILKDICFPTPSPHSAGCYMKLRRRKAVDISIAGVAFQAETDPYGNTITKARFALGGVAPTPVRVPEAEGLIRGLGLDAALDKTGACGRACMETARPIDDLRATADYKRTIVNVFAQRAARRVLTTLKNRRDCP